MKALSLQDRIALSPFVTTKVWGVLALISIAFLVLGQKYGDRFGLLAGFFLAVGLHALILTYTDLRLASLFPSQELEGVDPWGLLAMTREVASTLGVRTPQVHLLQIPTPLAFSAGVLESHTTLFVSEELARHLSRDETKAIIAYELARVKNHATRSATVGAALASLLLSLAWFIDGTLFLGWPLRRFFSRFWPRSWPRFWPHRGPITFLMPPLISVVTRLFVSRRSILAADAAAAALIGSPVVLAQALWKLESYMNTRPPFVQAAHSHLFTVNPPERGSGRLFHAQPSVKRRITRLLGHYPP